MNKLNDIIVKRYKPDDDCFVSEAINLPYNPDMDFSEKKMAEFNCGCLPPHHLHLKVGCVLMLLTNLSLTNGKISSSKYSSKCVNVLRFGKWNTIEITGDF